MSSVSSIQPLRRINSPNFSSIPSKEVSLPPHLKLMTGPKGELFRKLYLKGIVNAYGDALPPYDQISLPPFTHETVEKLKKELFSTFCPLSDMEGHRCSLPSLIQAISKILPNNVRFRFHQLVGSYVYHLLLEDENILDFLSKNFDIDEKLLKILFSSLSYEDIDIRSYIESSEYFDSQNLFQLSEQILGITSGRDRKIQERLKDFLHVVDNGFTRFLTVSFENTLLEWVICHTLPNKSVFTIDDVCVDLGNLLEGKDDPSISVKRHNPKKPSFTSLVHFLLGLAKAKDRHAFKAWLKLVTNLSRNQTSAIKGQEEDLYWRIEKYLFCSNHEDFFLTTLKNWMHKHHQHPFAAFNFLYHIHLLTQNRLDPLLLEKIWRNVWEPRGLWEVWKKKPALEGKLFVQMGSIIGEEGKGWPALQAILEISAFLHQMCFSDSFVQVEVTHHEFESLLLGLKMGKHTLLIQPRLCEPLRFLQAMCETDSEQWKKIQPKLARLFFSINPPENWSVPNEISASEFDIDFHHLSSLSLDILEKEKPSFLNYIAFLFLMISSEIPFKKKQDLAMVHSLPFFSSIKKEHLSGVKKQVETVLRYSIKKESDISESQFAKTWILQLYQYQEDENAFQAWEKSRVIIGIPLNLELISKIYLLNPEHAMRMLAFLGKNEKFLEAPEATMEMIAHCGRKYPKSIDFSTLQGIFHLRLLSYCTEILLLLLPKLSSPKNLEKQKLWARAIIWYATQCLEREEVYNAYFILKEGLENGFMPVQSQERKKALEIFVGKLWCYKNDYEETEDRDLILSCIQERAFNSDKNAQILLNFLTQEQKIDQEIFTLLLDQLAKMDTISEPLRTDCLHLILDVVEAIEALPLSFLYHKKETLERALHKLLKAKDPENLKQRILTQYVSKNLKTENTQFNAQYWLSTLRMWPLESRSQWHVADQLLFYAKKCGFFGYPSVENEVAQIAFQLLRTFHKSNVPCPLDKQKTMLSLAFSLNHSQEYWDMMFKALYELLVRVIEEQNLNKAIAFLENLSFAQSEKSQIGREALVNFCNLLLDDNLKVLLVSWLTKTKLFFKREPNTYERRCTQAFLSGLSIKFLTYIRNETHNKSVIHEFKSLYVKYIYSYMPFLTMCGIKFWDMFFNLLSLYSPENLFTYYFMANENGLFDCEERQIFFVKILNFALTYDCLEILPYFHSDDVLRKIFHPCNIILRARAETIILKAAFSSIAHLPAGEKHAFFTQVKPRFMNSKNEVTIYDRFPTLIQSKKIYLKRLWIQVEIVYILTLLHLNNREEAKVQLKAILNNPLFEIDCRESITLINTLAAHEYVDFHEGFDELLEKMGNRTPLGLEYEKVILYLGNQSDTRNIVFASKLLRNAMKDCKISLKKAALHIVELILDRLRNNKDSRAQNEFHAFLNLIFHINFQAAIAYDREFIEGLFLYFLPLLVQNKKPIFLRLTFHFFAELADHFENVWKRIYENKLLDIVIQIIPRLSLVQEDDTIKIFRIWASKVWFSLDKMVCRNAQLPLPPNEALEHKANLIRVSFNLFAENPPHPVNLGTYIISLITTLTKNDSVYRRLKKEDKDNFYQFLLKISENKFIGQEFSLSISSNSQKNEGASTSS